MTGAAQAAASSAAVVPSFFWLLDSQFQLYLISIFPMLISLNSDTAAKVPTMGDFLADIQSKNAAGASPPYAGQFVVYDLPDRDCAALASNGEYSIADDGVTKYKAYIDSIKAVLTTYSDVQTILVIGEEFVIFTSM